MNSPPFRRGAVLVAAALAAVLATGDPAAAAPLAAAPLAAAPLAAAPLAAAPPPAVPAAVHASTIGTGITLTWEQPRTGPRAVAFRVYENDVVVARTTTTTATIGVAFGSSHSYTVAAVGHRGRESARSAPVTGRAWLYGYNPECMPDPGVPVTVTAVTASAVALSWARHPLGGDLELRVDGRSLGTTPLTSARIGGLAPATAHRFTLHRYSNCHLGGGGDRLVAGVDVTTAAGDAARPASPADLVVTGRTDTTVGLSWSAAPGRYAVYDGATLVAVTTRTAVTVDRLHQATRHRFTVAALDAAGNESAHSAAVPAATETCASRPPRPVTPTAVPVRPSTVRLSWTFDAAATAYTVLDGAVPVATTRHSAIMLTGLAPASRHTYRVVATLPLGCGDSPASRGAEVTTPAGPAARPAAPTALTLADNVPSVWPTPATLVLSWTPAGWPGGGYRVYEGTTVVGETTGSTLTVPVGPGTVHEYVVVAVDAAGQESAPSPRLTAHARYMSPP